jgi:hypothetical protein
MHIPRRHLYHASTPAALTAIRIHKAPIPGEQVQLCICKFLETKLNIVNKSHAS